jgi:hypothetical protein
MVLALVVALIASLALVGIVYVVGRGHHPVSAPSGIPSVRPVKTGTAASVSL